MIERLREEENVLISQLIRLEAPRTLSGRLRDASLNARALHDQELRIRSVQKCTSCNEYSRQDDNFGHQETLEKSEILGVCKTFI